MAVDFSSFLEWAKDHFGEENIKLKHTAHGIEICTHSFFAHEKGIEDHKYHLWMNPSGGKSKHPGRGSYRCWKTDKMGSLVHLVARLDNISVDEAEEKICGVTSLRALEKKVADLFGHIEEMAAPVQEEPGEIELPEQTFLIDSLGEADCWGVKARQYLATRKIPTRGLYVCTENQDYGDRIVIPYHDREGRLTWFNARTMASGKKALRYLKCKARPGRTQEDVLFMTAWPITGTKVYVMEGELDALSVAEANLVGCALGGKHVSDTQVEMLRPYVPVLAFDTDDGPQDWGLAAMLKSGISLLRAGFEDVRYVRPPRIYKDWNKLLVERGPERLHQYAETFEKSFTPETPDVLLARRL